MPDDGIIQLRRNPSKQMLARTHASRHGKSNKGINTRSSKLTNTNGRKTHGLHHSLSGSSLNLASHNINTNNAEYGEHLHQSPRNNATNHKPTKSGNPKASGGMGSVAFGSHRYRGLSNGLGNLAQPHRKPVIQLENEENDEDDDEDNGLDSDYDNAEFEDYEDDDGDTQQRPPPPDRSDSQLSIGIQPVEPTPPKLSEETVISVSSLADMASALKGARDKTGFVGNEDLISTAVNRSKKLGNMARMVQGWNSTSPRGLASNSKKASVIDTTHRGNMQSIPGDEDPREYEKVFREYTNTRAISNPVISSLYRISISGVRPNISRSDSSYSAASLDSDGQNHSSNRIQLPSVKKVNSLVATTANQMSDYSERSTNNIFPEEGTNQQSNGTIESVSTYTLNKIWQLGWVDPEASTGYSKAPSRLRYDIQSQAMRVQQQLSNAKNKQVGS